MDYTNSKISLLWKVKRTQLEMVRDRGYYITPEDEMVLGFGVEEFVGFFNAKAQKTGGSFKQQLSSVYQKGDSKLYVMFLETPVKAKSDAEGTIGTEIVNSIVKQIETDRIKNLILITEVEITAPSQKKLEKLRGVSINHFLYRELGYNPTKHYLVPKHIVLSDDEAAQFFKENDKIKLNELPLISHYDPIARYYGMVTGQIVKIIRQNFIVETMVDEYVTYRCVSRTPLEREEPKEHLS